MFSCIHALLPPTSTDYMHPNAESKNKLKVHLIYMTITHCCKITKSLHLFVIVLCLYVHRLMHFTFMLHTNAHRSKWPRPCNPLQLNMADIYLPNPSFPRSNQSPNHLYPEDICVSPDSSINTRGRPCYMPPSCQTTVIITIMLPGNILSYSPPDTLSKLLRIPMASTYKLVLELYLTL